MILDNKFDFGILDIKNRKTELSKKRIERTEKKTTKKMTL